MEMKAIGYSIMHVIDKKCNLPVCSRKCKNISEVEIIGIDGNSCVAASAKGAAKMRFHTTISLDCVGVSNLQRFETTKEQLLKLGVVLR